MSARGSPPAATPLTRRARHAPTIVSNYRLMTPPHATKNLSFIVCCCCFRKPGRVEAAASSTSTLDVSHAHVDRMHTACALHTKRSPTQPIAAALDSPPPLPREGQAQQDEAEPGRCGQGVVEELRARSCEPGSMSGSKMITNRMYGSVCGSRAWEPSSQSRLGLYEMCSTDGEYWRERARHSLAGGRAVCS